MHFKALKSFYLAAGVGIAIAIVSCIAVPDKIAAEKTTEQQWWQKIKPNVQIGDFEYYAGDCAILQVNTTEGAASAKTIFKVSTYGFSFCKNRATPLIYDGEFLIFSVCETDFGAGSCGGGRYRSADMTNWQEDIGITWIKGEQYEAWRNLGSTSSKADAVKKIVE